MVLQSAKALGPASLGYGDHKAVSVGSTSSNRQSSLQKRSAPDWPASKPETHPLRHVTKRIKKSTGLDIVDVSPT